MRTSSRHLTLVLLAGLLCGCATTATETGPWGGLSPDDTHYLGEGSSIEVSHDGAATVHVRVKNGHLYLNDQDLGAYDKSQAVHFRRDGALTVDDEVRGRIDAPND